MKPSTMSVRWSIVTIGLALVLMVLPLGVSWDRSEDGCVAAMLAACGTILVIGISCRWLHERLHWVAAVACFLALLVIGAGYDLLCMYAV